MRKFIIKYYMAMEGSTPSTEKVNATEDALNTIDVTAGQLEKLLKMQCHDTVKALISAGQIGVKWFQS